MIDDKLCLNCNFAVEGKFCANCGQKTSTKRLNFGTVTHDFIHVLTHADKGVFSFAKEIAYKPGIIAKDYISGKRKKYFNPDAFLASKIRLKSMVP